MNRLIVALSIVLLPTFASAAAKSLPAKIAAAARGAAPVKSMGLKQVYANKVTISAGGNHFVINNTLQPGKPAPWRGGPAVAPNNYDVTGQYVFKTDNKVGVTNVKVTPSGPQRVAMPRMK